MTSLSTAAMAAVRSKRSAWRFRMIAPVEQLLMESIESGPTTEMMRKDWTDIDELDRVVSELESIAAAW